MPSPRKYHYPVGTTIGRLTVVGEEFVRRPDGRNRRLIKVECLCGSSKSVFPSNLGSGDTTSCGCFQKEAAAGANTTHGAKSQSATSDQHRLISVWRGIRSRCYNPNSRNYKWYGGKGVACEWDTFDDFYEWAMSVGYTAGREIDRIDSDLNYSSSNCWWATKQDNIMRAHLRAPKDLDAMIVRHAQENDMTCISVVEQALRSFFSEKTGKEV